jgi:hypothetical protein
MTEPEIALGKPFDLLFFCGAQTESGRSLRDIDDVAPVVAEALLVLASSPLRDAVAAQTNNIFARLEDLTPDGEPATWGSLGTVVWWFSGRQTARYFAEHTAEKLLVYWDAPPTSEVIEGRLREAAHPHHLADLDEFMGFLQVDKDGKERLDDFEREAARSLRGRRVKGRQLPLALAAFEETYRERLHGAVADGAGAASDLTSAFVSSCDLAMRSTIDAHGPSAGRDLSALVLDHVARMEKTLERQRQVIAEELAAAETSAQEQLRALEAAARSRLGPPLRLRRLRTRYLAAVANAFRLRFAYGLTEVALSALAETRSPLEGLMRDAEGLRDAFLAARQRCQNSMAAFVQRQLMPTDELTQRPLFSHLDLEQLYAEVSGAEWGAVAPETARLARSRVGDLSRWLGQPDGIIHEEVVSVCSSFFTSVSAMTADDFYRWKCRKHGLDPELLLRDSEELAPVLCRYDRARLQNGADAEELHFRLIGVPDREHSVFAGTSAGDLASTGDTERIIFVQMRLGFPSSALWHFPKYRRAYEAVRRQGRVAQAIFPSLRASAEANGHQSHTTGPASSGHAAGRGGKPRRRKGRAADGR